MHPSKVFLVLTHHGDDADSTSKSSASITTRNGSSSCGKQESHSRYLQGPCPQHPGPLVLGHVDGGDSLLVGLVVALTGGQDLDVLPVVLGQEGESILINIYNDVDEVQNAYEMSSTNVCVDEPSQRMRS